jgi:8-oxo-(d)GTP phosphatase
MLWFLCARPDARSFVGRRGIELAGTGTEELFRTLEEARAACSGQVLVIDDRLLKAGLAVRHIPPEAICNQHPYAPPVGVVAGGGLVVRRDGDSVRVLVIHRRGVWDLPKGKKGADESAEACALREVAEETAARDLVVLAEAGSTMHGYREGRQFLVKTTFWFLMTAPEQPFVAQAEEDIDEVCWKDWDDAKALIGYASLQEHLEEIEPMVRRTLSLASFSG